MKFAFASLMVLAAAAEETPKCATKDIIQSMKVFSDAECGTKMDAATDEVIQAQITSMN